EERKMVSRELWPLSWIWLRLMTGLEWCYIEDVMVRLGFAQEWVRRIMDCLSTVSLSVLWHGISFGHFSSQRGLCQGCPLSPYPFLFCAEGFSSLLRFAERNGSLIGVCAGRYALPVTHLLFADDSLLFLEQTPNVCVTLKNIFQVFEKVTSQVEASKEVLIKSVIQAIPSYPMGVFQLPKSLCKELSSLCARFWWGKTHNLGGLGFRDFEQFNKALVAKQGWRLLINANSFVGQVYRGRYFPNGDFLNAPLANSPQLIWRSLIWGWELLAAGLRWRIRDGLSIKLIETLGCLCRPLFDSAGWWNLDLLLQSSGKEE
ncbi:RNA-directed DNA polymerase reverse transcriptase-related family protein, partial [Prunus dulcis]